MSYIDNSTTPSYGGMFGLGPLSWGQKLGLVLSAVGDAANSARGVPTNGFANAIAGLRDMNQRRAFASTPWTGNANGYVQRLTQLGVPLDVALRMGAGYRALQGTRTLTPDEVAARGYRQGAVVQEGPSGEDNVVQQSDVKSPAAVQQAFEIARDMPETQAQSDRFDVARGRWGLPSRPRALPPQPQAGQPPYGAPVSPPNLILYDQNGNRLP